MCCRRCCSSCRACTSLRVPFAACAPAEHFSSLPEPSLPLSPAQQRPGRAASAPFPLSLPLQPPTPPLTLHPQPPTPPTHPQYPTPGPGAPNRCGTCPTPPTSPPGCCSSSPRAPWSVPGSTSAACGAGAGRPAAGSCPRLTGGPAEPKPAPSALAAAAHARPSKALCFQRLEWSHARAFSTKFHLPAPGPGASLPSRHHPCCFLMLRIWPPGQRRSLPHGRLTRWRPSPAASLPLAAATSAPSAA